MIMRISSMFINNRSQICITDLEGNNKYVHTNTTELMNNFL